MTFPLQTLDEVVDVRSGKRLPKGHDFADFATSHPYIRARDIRDGLITFDDPVYISEETHQVIKKYTVSDGDVCITIVGANVGDVGTVPEHLDGANLTENAVKLVNLRNLDSRYLKYILLSSELQRTMKLVAAGAAQPKLGLYKIKALEIPYPSFPVQKRIADILSAYDDLIDNNNRRIALLEEAIHRLYREWFVHLRFPGHEHTPVVAGVPQGWEKRPLAEIAHVNAKSIRKNDAPESIEYIDISSVGTGIVNEIKAIDFADAPSRARRVVSHGDIIWSTVRPGNRAYSLILNPNPNTIASTGFAVLTAQIVPFTFLYQAVITDEFVEHMAKVAKGAAYPAVSTSDFEKARILVPSQSLLNEFEQMAKPIARQTQTLRLQNEKLREARDALLPRLMNGSLPV